MSKSALAFMTSAGPIEYTINNKAADVEAAILAAMEGNTFAKLKGGENTEQTYIVTPSDFLGGFVVIDIDEVERQEKAIREKAKKQKVEYDPVDLYNLLAKDVQTCVGTATNSVSKLIDLLERLRTNATDQVEHEPDFFATFDAWYAAFKKAGANEAALATLDQFRNFITENAEPSEEPEEAEEESESEEEESDD